MHVYSDAESASHHLDGEHRIHNLADYSQGTSINQSYKYDVLKHTFSMKSWREMKETRTLLLMESDWRLISDYPETDIEEWKTYRQKLRDIPQDYSKVEDVVFPARP